MVELDDIKYFIIPELYDYLKGLESTVNGETNTEPANNDSTPEDNNDG